MSLTINPRALMHEQTEVKIGLSEAESGRGYVHIRAAFGLSRWAGVMPAGRTSEPAAAMPGDLEYDVPWWAEENPYA